MKAVLLIVQRWENTLPNFITLGRFLICLWGLNVFYWWDWNPWYMVLCCVLGMVFDGVDGWVARTYGSVSFSGKLLDPLVDKLIIWNAVFTFGAWTIQLGDGPSKVIALLCVPPFALIGIYDYMTMKMRATDEGMVTSPVAKTKQVILFTSLGALMLGMCFADTYSRQPDVLALYATHMLLQVIGAFFVWTSLHMTVRSARVYFANTKDTVTQSWSRVGWVRFLLAVL